MAITRISFNNNISDKINFTIKKFFIIFTITIILLFLFQQNIISAKAKVTIYDTLGYENPQNWKILKSSDYQPSSYKNIVIENKKIRIKPLVGGGIKQTQYAAHEWFYKINGKFERITSTRFGDYTYFVDSALYEPTGVDIVEVSDNKVIVDFQNFNHYVAQG